MKIKNILLIALSTVTLISLYLITRSDNKDKVESTKTHSFCDECCQY